MKNLRGGTGVKPTFIMKKIQNKIVSTVTVVALAVAIISCVCGILITRFSTAAAVEKSIEETASISAMATENAISIYTSVVKEIASNSILTDENVSAQEKKDFLNQKVAEYYMRYASLIDTNGMDILQGVDVSAEPFFQRALEGETYLSSPYILNNGTDCCMIVSTPVKKNDQVVAVLYASCDTVLLQDIVSGLEIGEHGDAYILDGTGAIIAYKDIKKVLAQENLTQYAQENPDGDFSRTQLAIEKKMIAGETGIEKYRSEGQKWMQSYHSITGTDGWSIAVRVSEGEFMRPAWIGNLFLIAIVLILIAASTRIAVRIGRSIADPILKCIDRLKLMAAGDLHSPVPEIHTQDEVKILADSTKDLTDNFQKILDEVGSTLERIAAGDLTEASANVNYPGDFAVLKGHLRMINQRLNHTMRGIIAAAEQVYSGAEQVSSTGALLAQGSSDQAGAIDMLSGDMGDLTSQISNAAEGAENASNLSNIAKGQLMEGIDFMNNLIVAVQEIEDKANEISKIIHTIDDIASQTNILALNASIEAARAGEAGKGFAVIADDVRDLAVQSSDAAKDTGTLIRESVAATRRGTELANLTSEALNKVVQGAVESVEHIHEISGEVHQQSVAVNSINQRIEEISLVVQTNTATSQESAATAEELSRQAGIMKQLVSKFKLEKFADSEAYAETEE